MHLDEIVIVQIKVISSWTFDVRRIRKFRPYVRARRGEPSGRRSLGNAFARGRRLASTRGRSARQPVFAETPRASRPWLIRRFSLQRRGLAFRPLSGARSNERTEPNRIGPADGGQRADNCGYRQGRRGGEGALAAEGNALGDRKREPRSPERPEPCSLFGPAFPSGPGPREGRGRSEVAEVREVPRPRCGEIIGPRRRGNAGSVTNEDGSRQGAPRPARRSSIADRKELWCLAHAMTAAAAVALWHRAHLYKAIVCVVLALIAIQYLLSGVIDRRSIETIFTINATRYADRTYRHHPRGLIIYGPVTVSSLLASNNVTETTMHWAGNRSHPDFSKSDAAFPTRNAYPVPSSLEFGSTTPNSTNGTALRRCPLIPPNLVGPLSVGKSPPELSVMEKEFSDVKPGGRGCPTDCVARHRVAIVIPFRDRPQHLQALLYNLHPMLLRQQIDYQIFVVEQKGSEAFNRAMLMNVGYVEALKERTFDCFIFHDVDLLPEDDRNLYTCPEQPRHMSVAVDKFKYRLPYADLFGGVSAMSREHFRLVNGFSNVFWGWGGEDDDMANRIKARGLHISRYPANVARYKMLTHKKEKANPKRYEYLKTGKKRFATDGLSNLQYELVDEQKPKLYTWLLVKLTPPQPS